MKHKNHCFKGTAITELLSKGDDRVAEPSGRSCRADKRSSWTLTGIRSILARDVQKKNLSCSPPPPPISLIDWLTDLYCHSSTADSDLHTYITLYVLGWIAATCVNSAWGRCPPGLCITDNLYKEVQFTPPGPRTFPLSHQRSGCG